MPWLPLGLHAAALAGTVAGAMVKVKFILVEGRAGFFGDPPRLADR